MSLTLFLMSDRPAIHVDVVTEVLRAVSLRAEVFGLFELRAPWAIRVPSGNRLAFYVMAEGSARLDLDEEPARRIALKAGDAVLLPHGVERVLRAAGRAKAAPVTLGAPGFPLPHPGEVVRFGGNGATTRFMAGAFSFGRQAHNILLETLPPVLHLPAERADEDPHFAAIVQLILAESSSPGPGSGILAVRLAEIILVHALRTQIAGNDLDARGFRALADPVIGAALRLMHASPAERWTVERLASEVGYSRSAFAARFTEVVGEAPLQYLTRWRMTLAAGLLRDTGESVAAVAERVGYVSPPAFRKAFSRVMGTGPGAYRRGG